MYEPKSVSWPIGTADFDPASTVAGSSCWRELRRWHEFSAAEEFDQGLAEDSVPTFEHGQLIRSLSQFGKEGGDAREGAAGAVMLTMTAGDVHGGAAGMAGLSADGLEQQRPAGDGLAMMIGIGQAHE
jgi:hypothetical protein